MKIYETQTAPNPRRVRIFLAEKGVKDVEYVQVDIKAGDNLKPEVLAKNPLGKVPYLELDDGTVITETTAICRYFEELYPENPLMGSTPQEKAQVEMWQRLCDIYFMLQVGMCFQHTTGYFKDRMTPVPEWGVEAGKNAVKFLSVVENQLADNTYVAGENFSIADIILLCAVDFARVIKIRMGDEHPNLQRWYELVNTRESVKA
ncbi:glutathione S-transferase family protein [Parendozoicomonas haliclonae]|uniref:Glutathione S-transferase n=1 Tax=Parendozoicomonas haliclonae TaxID=1960125 RepID=A0A1X7AQ36_9GAMM|nr:glutathione S-transferase family protein [Parendozoicomonas haliclonae]SMA50232.1 Glutathione S-transferase [Parendozoicomonas haliclonae]